MSIIKSFAVGLGDMFYIKHNTENFTIVDCNLADTDHSNQEIIEELKLESAKKEITRFISTHPDEDHIKGLCELDNNMGIQNFYCVENKAKKNDPSKDFKKYCELRDSEKAFYIKKNIKRKWMNESTEERSSSGISILWPDINNLDYKVVLSKIEAGESPNNTSAIIKYGLQNGVNILWMGDLEKEFMKKIETGVDWPKIDILFAPHHGRKSGRVPKSILDKLKPKMVIIGEAPSINLDYYDGYNKITQNSTGDIVLDCVGNKVHIHVEKFEYKVNFLSVENEKDYNDLKYLGTLNL